MVSDSFGPSLLVFEIRFSYNFGFSYLFAGCFLCLRYCLFLDHFTPYLDFQNPLEERTRQVQTRICKSKNYTYLSKDNML